MTTPYAATGITLPAAPGPISPEQFRDVWSGTTEVSGEIRLAIAVLVGAIEDLRKFGGGVKGFESRRLFDDARRWVMSNDRKWAYSFVNIAEILNIPYVRVRRRLLEHAPICSRVGRQYGVGLFRRDRPPKRSLKVLRRRLPEISVGPIP